MSSSSIEAPAPAPDALVVPGAAASETKKVWRVGTLLYSRYALFTLFFWLLWGDFCFMLMEQVVAALMPLKLRSLGASNFYISLFISTLPAGMNFLVNPVVSFRSDRFRSRFGRRIPFLAASTPFLALCLALLAYAPEIAAYLHAAPWVQRYADNPATVALAVAAVLLVAFQFFNIIQSSIYYYLFNDVVPPELLGRFMALFRVVATAALFCFNMFLLPRAETHYRPILIGAAALYFVGFMAMCVFVKEGQYPPPPPNVDRRSGFLSAVRTYARECFSHRLFLYFYSFNALSQAANVFAATFMMFFFLSIGIGLDQLGKVGAWAVVPSLLLMYPAGMLIDRVGSLRIIFIAAIGNAVLPVLAFFFLRGTKSWLAYLLLAVPVSTLWTAVAFPFYISALPKDRFGQFGSADAMIRSTVVIATTLLGGWLMDSVKDLLGGGDAYYRYLFVISGSLYGIALIFLLLFRRQWRLHGGGTPQGYRPPVAATG